MNIKGSTFSKNLLFFFFCHCCVWALFAYYPTPYAKTETDYHKLWKQKRFVNVSSKRGRMNVKFDLLLVAMCNQYIIYIRLSNNLNSKQTGIFYSIVVHIVLKCHINLVLVRVYYSVLAHSHLSKAHTNAEKVWGEGWWLLSQSFYRYNSTLLLYRSSQLRMWIYLT